MASIILSLFLLASAAFAQTSEEEKRRERAEAEEYYGSKEELMTARGRSARWSYDYGLAVSTTYTASENNDRQDTLADLQDHSWDYDLKLFFLYRNAPQTTKFYVRTGTRYTETKKNSPGIRGNDFIQPRIELLYGEYVHPRRFKHVFRLGRQFVQLGRGLAFGLAADGLVWEGHSRRWRHRVLVMRQDPSDNNLDFLSPGAGRTKRRFYSADTLFRAGRKSTLGAYALVNDDRNDENAVGGQRYQMDSVYYGLTLEGSPVSRLSYWAEFVLERGKTYPHNSAASKVDLRSNAFDFGLRFYWGGDLAPTLFAEFAGGSGDPDRAGNVHSSNGGSTIGKDTLFRGFGGLSLGSALAPALANIHVFKLGGSVKPLARSSHAFLNDMTIQTAYYQYVVDDEGGATSDPVSNTALIGPLNNIGREVDAQLSWRPLADVRYLFQAGYFMPGAIYGVNRSPEEYYRFKVSFDL